MNPATFGPRLLLCMILMCCSAHAQEPSIEGTWLTGDGDGWVEVRITSDGLSGIVQGSPNDNPDRPDKDVHNAEPELRERELIGLELFSGFAFDGGNKWKGGTIYDPNNGKTYRCVITQVDNDTLKVRGYIGVPLLGRTETWTRRKD